MLNVSAPKPPKVRAPKVKLPGTQYYTTKAQAQAALAGPTDVVGEGIRFAKGRGYYLGAAPKSSLATAAAGTAPAAGMDPYSAMLPGVYTPAQISQMVGQYTGGYPAPMTLAQQAALGQSWLQPQVDAITSRTNAASQAIGQYANDAAQALAGINWAAPYTTAEQGQAAVDSALQASLNNAGSSDAADLGNRLAALNDPSVAQAANAVSANGGANATTQVAQGSSALAELIANQAAAQEYGLKQPGIERQTGIQQIGQNEAQGQDEIAQAFSQLPSILSGLMSESDQDAGNKAQAATSLFSNILGQSDTNAANRAQLAEDWAKYQGAQAASIAEAEGKDAAQVAAAEAKAEAQARAAAAKAAAPSTAWTKLNGYVSDGNGNAIPNNKTGQLQPIPGFKLNADGTGVVKVTPPANPAKAKASAVRSATAAARSIIGDNRQRQTTYKTEPKTDQFGNVIKGPDGKPVMERVPVGTAASGSYYAAIHQIVASVSADLSPYMSDDDIIRFAQRLANTYWKPGQAGRPGTG